MGSSSTSPRSTDTDTTTTPRPPGWRLARPQTPPAGSWLPATSPSAPRSTSTTAWSSSTPTSCHLPALAISLNNLKLLLLMQADAAPVLQPPSPHPKSKPILPTRPKNNHRYRHPPLKQQDDDYSVDVLILIYLFSYLLPIK